MSALGDLLGDLFVGVWRWLWLPSLPGGAGWLAGALFMLLGAALNSQAGRGRPHEYLPLAEVTGRVVDVSRWHLMERRPTGDAFVTVTIDPGGGLGAVRLEDPELEGARDRLRTLRDGQVVTARYDGQTKRIWELESMGLTVIGAADIARWQAAEQRAGMRRAGWLLAGGLLLLAGWIARLRRGTT